MDYPLPVFLAVLGAATLHAAWNALVRAGTDPLLHTASIVLWTGVYAIPVVILLPLPAPESWSYLFWGVVVHIGYYFTLAGAYREGTLSVIYPIIRGCAPLLVSVGSLIFLSENLTTQAWIGVTLVSLGVLVIALRSGMSRPRHGIAWALACSATIATYSIIDGQGARVSNSPIAFAGWLYITESIVFGAILVGLGKRKAFVNYVRVRLKSTAIGGFMSGLGFAIVLWAMTLAPIAAVSATRESSVLFAVVLGVWLLKEKLKLRQWLAAVAILSGLIFLRI